MLTASDACASCDVRAVCIYPNRIRAGSASDAAVPRVSVKSFDAGKIVAPASDKSDDLHIVRSGWVAQYRISPSGKRQIIAVSLPGEAPNFWDIFSPEAAGPTIALSPAETCVVSRSSLKSILLSGFVKADALFDLCQQQARRTGEHLVTLGRRSAESGLARLVLDVRERLRRAGEDVDDVMPFHMRQQDIADYLGLTQVHVSRVMSALRDQGVADFSRRSVTILDVEALQALADQH